VGINRSTLSEFEKGARSLLITLIQLLRGWNQLYVLKQFEEQLKLSPIQLAELQRGNENELQKQPQRRQSQNQTGNGNNVLHNPLG